MALSFISRLFSLTQKFKEDNGSAPKVVYLGTEEAEALRKIMKEEGIEWSEGEGEKVARAGYVGIPVYIVDEKTYLACG